MMLTNASGALFSLGVMSLLAGLVLGLMTRAPVGVGMGGQGIVLIVLALIARKLRSPVFYGVLMGLMLLVTVANLASLVLAMVQVLSHAWTALVSTLLAAGLAYAMYRAMLAARFLKSNPEDPQEVFE
jgi:hypothetical protein